MLGISVLFCSNALFLQRFLSFDPPDFWYPDEKEEGVLGSLPLLSFQIGVVQPADNITRKHAFKVSRNWGDNYMLLGGMSLNDMSFFIFYIIF